MVISLFNDGDVRSKGKIHLSEHSCMLFVEYPSSRKALDHKVWPKSKGIALAQN